MALTGDVRHLATASGGRARLLWAWTGQAIADWTPHGGADVRDLAFSRDGRRLSIVDVAGGHQPMTSDDGRYAVTFNGEIFNHPDLRAALESLGHRYGTNSDTESILRGFQQWGGSTSGPRSMLRRSWTRARRWCSSGRGGIPSRSRPAHRRVA